MGPRRPVHHGRGVTERVGRRPFRLGRSRECRAGQGRGRQGHARRREHQHLPPGLLRARRAGEHPDRRRHRHDPHLVRRGADQQPRGEQRHAAARHDPRPSRHLHRHRGGRGSARRRRVDPDPGRLGAAHGDARSCRLAQAGPGPGGHRQRPGQGRHAGGDRGIGDGAQPHHHRERRRGPDVRIAARDDPDRRADQSRGLRRRARHRRRQGGGDDHRGSERTGPAFVRRGLRDPHRQRARHRESDPRPPGLGLDLHRPPRLPGGLGAGPHGEARRARRGRSRYRRVSSWRRRCRAPPPPPRASRTTW